MLDNHMLDPVGVRVKDIERIYCEKSDELLNGKHAFMSDSVFISHSFYEDEFVFSQELEGYVEADQYKETYLDDEISDITVYQLVEIDEEGNWDYL